MSYIDVWLTEPGTQVEIVLGDPGKRQKHIRAIVGPAPYKKHGGKGDLTNAAKLLQLAVDLDAFCIHST